MSQLDPHRAALVRLLDRKPEHVVRVAVVESALALQVGEQENGLDAVQVGGAGGEEGAFGGAGVGCVECLVVGW